MPKRTTEIHDVTLKISFNHSSAHMSNEAVQTLSCISLCFSNESNFTRDDYSAFMLDLKTGNLGAALFMIAYIGFYGLGIVGLFAHQLKETQRQKKELPASFLKTLWDVPIKNKLYEELANVNRLKRIFRAYFCDHETCVNMSVDDVQALVNERAHSCAMKYRQKLRRLHLSHTDYLVTADGRLLDHLEDVETDEYEKISKRLHSTRRSLMSFNQSRRPKSVELKLNERVRLMKSVTAAAASATTTTTTTTTKQFQINRITTMTRTKRAKSFSADILEIRENDQKQKLNNDLFSVTVV